MLESVLLGKLQRQIAVLASLGLATLFCVALFGLRVFRAHTLTIAI